MSATCEKYVPSSTHRWANQSRILVASRKKGNQSLSSHVLNLPLTVSLTEPIDLEISAAESQKNTSNVQVMVNFQGIEWKLRVNTTHRCNGRIWNGFETPSRRVLGTIFLFWRRSWGVVSLNRHTKETIHVCMYKNIYIIYIYNYIYICYIYIRIYIYTQYTVVNIDNSTLPPFQRLDIISYMTHIYMKRYLDVDVWLHITPASKQIPDAMHHQNPRPASPCERCPLEELGSQPLTFLGSVRIEKDWQN